MNDLLKVLFVAVLGGALPVFIKIGLGVIPPQTFIFLRYLIALLILLPLFFYKKEKLTGKKKNLLFVAIFAYGNILFAALGIKKTSPVMSQMLYSVVPIITAIFSHFFLHEKLNLKKIVGVILGFIGVSIIIIVPELQKNQISSGSLIGNLIVFLGVLSYSIYTISSKPIQNKNSSLAVMTFLALFTLIVQGFIVPFELSDLSFIQNISPRIILALLYVGIIGTSAYHFLYLHVIKSSGPITASLVLYLQPIFSFISAFFLLRETISLAFVIGSMLALSGAYITSRKR